MGNRKSKQKSLPTGDLSPRISSNTKTGRVEIISIDEDLDAADFFDADACRNACAFTFAERGYLQEFEVKFWQCQRHHCHHRLALAAFVGWFLFCLLWIVLFAISASDPTLVFPTLSSTRAIVLLILFLVLLGAGVPLLIFGFYYMARQCYIINRHCAFCQTPLFKAKSSINVANL